ncbi:MAG: TIGR03557 family F420-dependent LLM class oxidoreductase [Acidimicrobiia bacterium]
MTELGYSLSSEEHDPRRLVELAGRAEQAGFSFALISDHFHPWIDRQGHSPFVWSVLGGIAQATDRLVVGTGVTCPTIRIHPAIIAQAAATTAAMMPGRFFLGVGTGENLNEHVHGDRWPPADTRLDMLEEALEVIRLLWEGKLATHHGRFYTVEEARLYTLPEEPPPIMMAASGRQAGRLAGRIADGLIGTSPEGRLVEAFASAGGADKPRYGQLTVCWAESEEEARATAAEWWPTAAFKGPLNVELPLPSHFEQVAAMVTEEEVAEEIVCGPDPDAHLAAIEKFEKAGYDRVYLHQVGPDQEGFFGFFEQKIVPKFG